MAMTPSPVACAIVRHRVGSERLQCEANFSHFTGVTHMFRCLFLMCLALVGCTPQSPSASDADTNRQATIQLQSRLLALEARSLDLSTQITALTNRINSLEQQWTTAEFDPTDWSYQRVDAKPGIGSFAISVQDIQAFGDGVRIRLNLGNPSTAVVSGVGLKLRYGPRVPAPSDPDFGQHYSTWLNSLQSKDEELTAELRPGSWNPISVTLPKIDTKNFGHLEVSISNKTISLSGR